MTNLFSNFPSSAEINLLSLINSQLPDNKILNSISNNNFVSNILGNININVHQNIMNSFFSHHTNSGNVNAITGFDSKDFYYPPEIFMNTNLEATQGWSSYTLAVLFVEMIINRHIIPMQDANTRFEEDFSDVVSSERFEMEEELNRGEDSDDKEIDEAKLEEIAPVYPKANLSSPRENKKQQQPQQQHSDILDIFENLDKNVSIRSPKPSSGSEKKLKGPDGTEGENFFDNLISSIFNSKNESDPATVVKSFFHPNNMQSAPKNQEIMNYYQQHTKHDITEIQENLIFSAFEEGSLELLQLVEKCLSFKPAERKSIVDVRNIILSLKDQLFELTIAAQNIEKFPNCGPEEEAQKRSQKMELDSNSSSGDLSTEKTNSNQNFAQDAFAYYESYNFTPGSDYGVTAGYATTPGGGYLSPVNSSLDLTSSLQSSQDLLDAESQPQMQQYYVTTTHHSQEQNQFHQPAPLQQQYYPYYAPQTNGVYYTVPIVSQPPSMGGYPNYDQIPTNNNIISHPSLPPLYAPDYPTNFNNTQGLQVETRRTNSFGFYDNNNHQQQQPDIYAPAKSSFSPTSEISPAKNNPYNNNGVLLYPNESQAESPPGSDKPTLSGSGGKLRHYSQPDVLQQKAQEPEDDIFLEQRYFDSPNQLNKSSQKRQKTQSPLSPTKTSYDPQSPVIVSGFAHHSHKHHHGSANNNSLIMSATSAKFVNGVRKWVSEDFQTIFFEIDFGENGFFSGKILYPFAFYVPNFEDGISVERKLATMKIKPKKIQIYFGKNFKNIVEHPEFNEDGSPKGWETWCHREHDWSFDHMIEVLKCKLSFEDSYSYLFY